MQTGCTLREDLLIEVARLAKEGRFDDLLLASTGTSEPLPRAETCTLEGVSQRGSRHQRQAQRMRREAIQAGWRSISAATPKP